MANELQITLNAQLRNGSHIEIFQPNSLNVSQAAIGAQSGVVSVGTTEEAMPTGDVATEGWLFLQNLDVTNYVTFGPDSSGAMVAMGRLEPGEIAALRMSPGVTLRWQANTAACKVKMLLLED